MNTLRTMELDRAARRPILCCLVIHAFLACTAAAQVTYISQLRGVSASYCNGQQEKTSVAPDFGPFTSSVSVPYAYASQTSSLGAGGIVAEGDGGGAKTNGCLGEGISWIQVVFQVDIAMPWQLTGTLWCIENTYSDQLAKVSLVGPGVNLQFSTKYGTMPIAGAGTLQPGTYTLIAQGRGKGGGALAPSGVGQYEFQLNFDASCYADCDNSGTLTIDDFICFQTFLALGDPYADCDGDASLKIDDFICFQTFFAIGC